MEKKITAEEYEKIDSLRVKAIYSKDEESGDYVISDVDALLSYALENKAHKDRAVNSRGSMQQKLQELEEENSLLKSSSKKKAEDDGDYKALYEQEKLDSQAWKDKYDDLHKNTIEKDTKSSFEKTVGETVMELAGKQNPMLSAYIEKRIKTEHVDGNVKTVVLDDAGQNTGLTVEDLIEEVRGNEIFHPALKGRGSSGGDSSGGSQKGVACGDWVKAFDPKTPDLALQAQLRREDPTRFATEHAKYIEKRNSNY